MSAHDVGRCRQEELNVVVCEELLSASLSHHAACVHERVYRTKLETRSNLHSSGSSLPRATLLCDM
jgi:hypothetical protein